MIRVEDQVKLKACLEHEAFDPGTPEEMCETALIISDEMVAQESIRQAIIDNISTPITDAVYDELMLLDSFEELPSPEEMSELIANSLAILVPELVKRVFQRTLGVARDVTEP